MNFHSTRHYLTRYTSILPNLTFKKKSQVVMMTDTILTTVAHIIMFACDIIAEELILTAYLRLRFKTT